MKKKLKINPALFVVDYNKRLKQYHDNTHFGTEITFINTEIQRIEEEIKQQNSNISEIISGENPKKIQGTDNDPGALDYFVTFQAHNFEYLPWLKQRKTSLEKPNKTGLNYFSWQGTDDQLKRLFTNLMETGFIDQKHHFQDFSMIFVKDLTQCKAVKWTASNRLLAYLFNQMNSGSSPFILSGQWQSIIGKNKLFKNKAGKYLTAQDLATALNAINDPLKGLNPKGSEKIDEILENLNTLRP